MFCRGVCFFTALFFISLVCAQPMDDIPFLFEEEEHPATQEPMTTPIPAKNQNRTENKSSPPIRFNKSQQQPNIGLNSEPLTELTITTPPLPKISVDLTDSQQEEIHPKQIINTRTQNQSIDILPTTDFLYDSSANNISFAGEIGSSQNVRGFEIEGFYLGMTPEEVIDLSHENGYKITSSKEEISKFRTGYYENLCKRKVSKAPEKIRECISKISKSNNTTYLSTLKISRSKTHESIEFNFSSPATNNRVWKIHYENKGDNSLNFTIINTQKKLNRQEAFLNALFNKFGTPDDPKNYIWGSENDAFMQAGMYGSNYDAFITITDSELEADDLLEAKDWLDETKPFDHFGFED